jgi:fructokinase
LSNDTKLPIKSNTHITQEMKTKNKDILCIGEMLWDRLPGKSLPGGAPMNVALHLVKVGYKVQICSSLGNDQAGREFAKFLGTTRLDTHLIQTNDVLPTSEVPTYLDENNNATYDILEPVAWDQLELTDELIDAARAVGAIVYGTLASRNEMTRKTVSSLLSFDNVKLIDINMRPPYIKQKVVEDLVKYADIAKMNDDELYTLAGWHNVKYRELNELVRWCSDTYKLDIICVTMGKNGALVFDKGEVFNHPGFKVEAVDTVGSGDAFLAGFVSKLFDDKSIEEALTYACALGAYVATQHGATPIYYSHQIEMILKQ